MNFKGGYKYFKPIIAEKNIGVTDNTMFVTINNKPKLLQFLKSDLIKFILKITQFNYGSNAKNEFHILNLISIPPIKYLGSNNDVYKYFNLTEKEKNFINKIIQ